VKSRPFVVIPVCLMLFLLPLSIVGVAGISPKQTDLEIAVPLASSAESDGYIVPGEYDDALEIDLSNATWEAYLYLKHDGKYLYVFLDHVSDTFHHPAGFDNFWVTIDTLSDGGEAPKEDDYMFHSSGHHVYLGDGPHLITNGEWEELIGHGEPHADLADKAEPFQGGEYAGSGPGAFGVSQKSKVQHAIFEIQIPIRGWEFEEANWTVGFCAAVGSPGTEGDFLAKAVWPDTAYADFTGDFYAGGVESMEPPVYEPQEGSFAPPSTWGTLTLIDVPPLEPETEDYSLYIIIVAIVIVVIITAVVLLLRKRG
jgi:hypothetical protein